ncbi:hypothetical protein BGZ99_005801 [Dissophora globulifera]|uniref:Uncharacterized protein n=1 Tax=Dissophora globulifera TaxID=979702 RepID=A0A9P6UT86_9FUNG|nr:hypothetical protein BGZ99_005801 [Dissophora globulifera]
MAQESTAFPRDYHSRNQRPRSRSKISTRTPSPTPPYEAPSSAHGSTDLDPAAQHDENHANAASLANDGTGSLLGSVWNLVKDARNVAAREFDKLFDHFPYKSAARLYSAAEQENTFSHERILRKPRTSATGLATSSLSAAKPKSLLGHGPAVRQRGLPSKYKHRTLAQGLLDQGAPLDYPIPLSKKDRTLDHCFSATYTPFDDLLLDLRNHLNDVSPVSQLRVSSYPHLNGSDRSSSVTRSRQSTPSGSDVPSASEKSSSRRTISANQEQTSLKRPAHALGSGPKSGSGVSTELGHARLQSFKTWPRDNNDHFAKQIHHPSSSGSDAHSSVEPTALERTISSLKRDSSYASYTSIRDRHSSTVQDSDDMASSIDGRPYDDEDSDHSDYLSATTSRRRRLSREPSETPSISSVTRTLSISGKANTHTREPLPPPPPSYRQHLTRPSSGSSSSSSSRHQHHPHQRENRHQLKHKRPQSAIYPRDLPGSTVTEGHRPSSSLSTIADPHSNPFLDSRGTSPLPTLYIQPPGDQMPTPPLSSSSATIENYKLNELQQELAAIKEQLRSLVSARESDLRSQSSPSAFGSGPPPPPPPTLNQGAGSTPLKKWTPPESEAGRSMRNVLKELSSQKVQLRKTGSPFVR